MTQMMDVELDYAKWSTRAWSWIIDFFVVALYWLVITVVDDLVLWPVHAHFHDGPGLGLSAGFAGARGGGGGGGVVMGESVVVDAVTGGAPTWQQSFVRYIFYGISLIFLSGLLSPWTILAGVAVLVIDYLVVPLSDAKRRTLHDVAAGTVVRQMPPDADGGQRARSRGRRWLVRTTLVLILIMIVGGTVSSWLERQPSSSLGLASTSHVATVVTGHSPSV